MKHKPVSLIIIGLLAAYFLCCAIINPVGAQKLKQAGDAITFADLDAGARLNVGKSVFYTPTTAEGCDATAPQGCKYPAVITGVPTISQGDGRFTFYRTGEGHIAVHLVIFRPASKGGTFQKDYVGFTSSPIEGTCRSIQSEDLRGVL